MNFGLNNKFTLLSEEEIFGSQEIDIISKMGGRCAISDFAILLGAYVSNDYFIEDDSSLKGRTAWWWTRSSAVDGDVRFVSAVGSREWNFAGMRPGAVRPALPFSSISDISPNGVRGRSGFLEVEYGEYPQYAVDTRLARTLNRKYSAGRLKKTGKTYTTDSRLWNANSESFKAREHYEYEYNGKKYVKVKYVDTYSYKLSNGKSYQNGDEVWVEVAPIKWLVDEKSRLMLSKTCLASGIRFCNDGQYRGNFENTEMYTFLNKYFAKDIIPINIATDRLINNHPSDSKLAEEVISKFKELDDKLDISNADKINDAIIKVHTDCNNYKSLDIELRIIKEIAIEAVKMDGLLLKYVLGNLNNDVDVVLAAVSQNPKAIEYAGIECRDNEMIILEAIKGYPQAIWCASQRIKKNKDTIIEYINVNEDFFKLLIYTNDSDLKEYKYDRSVAIAGIKISGENIMYFPDYYSDKEVVIIAFKNLKKKEMAEVIAKNLSLDLHDDESVMLIACGVKKECAKYASDRLRSKKSFIEKAFPDSKNDFDRIGRVKYSWGDLNNEYLVDVFDLAKAWADAAVVESKVSSTPKSRIKF